MAMSTMRCGRGLVLRCTRELSGETGPHLQRLVSAAAGQVRFILLDLSGSAYADSDGLRSLARLREELEAQRIALRIVLSAGSRIERALSLTGWDRMFQIYPSDRSAWRIGQGRRPLS